MSLVEQCKNLTPYNPFRNIIIVGRNSKNPEKRDSMKKKKKAKHLYFLQNMCSKTLTCWIRTLNMMQEKKGGGVMVRKSD